MADPFGQVLAEASHDEEETLIVECDPRRIEEVRRNWPFLRDRRIDAYAADPEPGDRLSRPTPRQPASACRPNGSRTRPPGSPGRTTAATGPAASRRFRGSTREIVRQLSAVERVRILVDDAALERQARGVLRKVGARLDAVEFFACPTNRVVDARLRPAVRHGAGAASVALTAWRFNAWAKYDDWERDAQVPARLASTAEAAGVRSRGMVLEGGSIDVNGAGLLLTTEECLLSPVQARNPGMSRARAWRPPARHIWASSA